jgi:HK97 family phage major capsid protein
MIADLDVKIKHKTREQEMVARMAQSGNVSNAEQREVERVHGAFSISRAVAQVANGRNLEGAEAEWAQEAQKEARSQGLQMTGQIAIPSIALRTADDHQATAGESGAGAVATVVPAAIEALRAPTVIEGLGATVIRNATGNLQFPRVGTKATGASATEVGNTTAAGLILDSVSMNPERVTANTTYSKQLILQGGVGIDTLIANDLSAAMNAYIDDRAFDVILADSDVDDQTAASGNTTDFSAMAVAMEAAVLAAGGNMAAARYAMSPKAYELTKNAVAVTGVSALFENGQFNGFPATATPYLINNANAGEGQVVFGNFAQGLLLAYFGGLDLLVDPYSAAGNAQVTLHVNRFFDVAVRQPGALSICTDLASS